MMKGKGGFKGSEGYGDLTHALHSYIHLIVHGGFLLSGVNQKNANLRDVIRVVHAHFPAVGVSRKFKIDFSDFKFEDWFS